MDFFPKIKVKIFINTHFKRLENFPHLPYNCAMSQKNISELQTALHYLNMGELKDVCEHLHIPFSGKKGEVIRRILYFLKSGEILTSPLIPAVSKAKKGVAYPLSPKTLILLGSYKNDQNTRLFMQKLVGTHFHFTAFGQDWIKEQWLAGTPPTYQEFANFWQREYETRQKRTATPKKEWAYLNFIQHYLEKNPNAKRKEIADAWKKERLAQVKKAQKILRSY